MNAWRPMSEAPMDGTRIDLLYPYPRGRQIGCYWETDGPLKGHWVRREPKWKEVLLPDDQWDYVILFNMQPLFWMPAPALPDHYLFTH